MICLRGACSWFRMSSMTAVLYALTLLAFSWITPIPVLAAPEVIIGYANISARVSPLWIAQEKGFFAKYGVAVQPVYMPGSPVMIASLSTGQIQLANSGGTAALGAAAGGLDLKPRSMLGQPSRLNCRFGQKMGCRGASSPRRKTACRRIVSAPRPRKCRLLDETVQLLIKS